MTDMTENKEALSTKKDDGPMRVLIDFALIFAFVLALPTLILPVLLAPFDFLMPVVEFWFSVLLLGGVLGVARLRGITLKSYGFEKIPLDLKLLKTVVAAVAFIWLYYQIVYPLVTSLTGEKIDVSRFDDIRGDYQMFFVYLIYVWIAAAFLEELIYRGLFFGRFEALFGKFKGAIWVAVFLQALIFGLSHTYQGVSGIIMIFGMGVLFAALYIKSNRKIMVPILVHGIGDTFFMLSLFYEIDMFIGFDFI